MRRLRRWIAPGLLLLLSLFLWENAAVRAGAVEGLRLCGRVLIPSLFPFSAVCGLWLRLGAGQGLSRPSEGLPRFSERLLRWCFGLSGQATLPVLFGLMGGYPLGAQLLGRMARDRHLTRREAVSASRICSQPGPAFLIGAVGAGLFGSTAAGLRLLGINSLSALATAALLADRRTVYVRRVPVSGWDPPSGHVSPMDRSRTAAAFSGAIKDAAEGMLRLCGIAVFFSAALRVLRTVLPLYRLPQWAAAAAFGSLELTNGVALLRGCPDRIAFVLAAGLSTWGGLCVHLQVLDALQAAGLPFRPFLRAKLLQTLLSLTLAAILSFVL